MAKLPFMQFYPADWIQDTQVLTSAAKGAWIDILCQLWVSDTAGSRTWNRKEFTTLLRLTYDEEIEEMVADLSRVGDVTLTDRDDNEVETFHDCTWISIKSRRIIRDRESLTSRKESHKKYNDKRAIRKRQVNDSKTTPIYQKSEVRSHTSELIKEKTPAHSSLAACAFDQFWKVYPRKVGKKAAMKAWYKIMDRPPIIHITESIARAVQTDQWKKDNGQFIPHPATWLNEGRWDDELMGSGGGFCQERVQQGAFLKQCGQAAIGQIGGRPLCQQHKEFHESRISRTTT
jgi:uncharacterized protein YdaU (DUF1376 family)